MAKDGDKTPDPTPPKDVIKTPPRIPSLPAGENRGKTFDFKAAVSNAMAAEGAGPPASKPGHERGVSWDQDVMDNQRIISPGQGTRTNDASQGGGNAASFMARTASKPPRPGQVSRGVSGGSSSGISPQSLDKGTDAYAREAEDALLRALEERDPMHRKANSGAGILAGVPDNLSLDEEKPVSSPTPSRAAVGSRPRLMSNGQQSMASRKPSERPPPKPAHKRQQTVEEALFGLTAALSAVQQDESRAGLRRGESTSGSEDDPNDRLAKTAELMFGKRFMRQRKSSVASNDGAAGSTAQNETPTHAPASAQDSSQASGTAAAPTSAKAKWNLVKANLDIHKKYDIPEGSEEGSLEGEDIEVGDVNDNVDKGGEDDGYDDDVNNSGGVNGKNKRRRRRRIKGALASPFRHLPYSDKIKNEWDLFSNFLNPRKATVMTWARYIFLYLWLPALGVAALLFHLFENPPTGRGPWETGDPSANATNARGDRPVDRIENEASISWWIIFVCIREVSILVMAFCIQAVLVDFFAIQTRAILRTFGPVITLLLVQSKGWPFLMSCWGILNFLLVTGNNRFHKHWLFWQDLWGLLNENNPSGDVTNTLWFARICAVASSLGAAVAVKRVVVGIYLGRQTFSNYSDQLAKVMNSMLQISQVAILSQAIEKKYWMEIDKLGDSDQGTSERRNLSDENLLSLIESSQDEVINEDYSTRDMGNKSDHAEDLGRVIDTDDVDPFTGSLSNAQKTRLADLCGRWEEPLRGPTKMDKISVGAVLQFRRALASMDTPYPFSGSFGLADTREHCVVSAQNVYDRLMLKNQSIGGKLRFDTLAVLAVQGNGELDADRAKDLIRLFRPDRDGGISCVDFVRSVDNVYKDLRMLRATVAASSKIDKALESIMNIVFYVAIFCIILAAYGFDPLSLFLSLSSIILAFAFMIGSASAKYFEGLLFILVQRPYGIGDRINVSNPESESNGGGAQGWLVEDVTLFTTTIYLAGTNERATISNGSLAKSRIINGARSTKAVVVIPLKFGVEVPYSRIEVFKSAVETFVKARPREWLALFGIRAGRIEAELGFVEYHVVLQHREAWQNITAILDSKHQLHCFMLELVKRLNLRYKQPALPILLNKNSAVEEAFRNGDDAAPLSPHSLDASHTDEVNAAMSMFDTK